MPSSREAFPLVRSSGVLLHPTSLPGGRLGREAYDFVDWLVAAGQSFWQILPLGPPDGYGSPYASSSAFAASDALLADPDAPVSARAIDEFRRRHAYWIDDWAQFSGSDGDGIAAQVRFGREWNALRSYANARGIRLIGDLPLYVDRSSADVAAHEGFFDMTLAAGVPPDFFSSTGQLWGNPPYRWGVLRADGYRWWIERFRRTLELVDATRIDHFRGLVSYWAVPYGEPTAERGRWLRGPGKALFDAVERELGPLPMIAEDLGHITPPVHRLRDELGVPGMHVLEFGFDGDPAGTLANHRGYAAVYTGTHDNDPVVSWWGSASDDARGRVEDARVAAGIAEQEPEWVLIELAFSSRSRLAVVQAQDVLGLGAESRMNLPATVGGNWQWRLEEDQLTDELAQRLRTATARWGRLANASTPNGRSARRTRRASALS
jgi:4-alpha-glucanotransferase